MNDGTDTDVVIVGGGPTGLTAAYLLARRGVRSTVIERRDTPSAHPRAHFINTRSMELFEIWGIADAIRAQAFPHERLPFDMMAHIGGITPEERAEISPGLIESCSQDRVEEQLLGLVGEYPEVTTLWSHNVTAVDDSGDRVTALATGPDGTVEIAGRFLIAADGANSVVRELMGVKMLGDPHLGSLINVYFEGDIMPEGEDPPLVSGPRNPEIMSAFISMDGAERWCFHLFYDPDKESLEDYPADRCESLIKQAWNAPDDIDIDIRSIGKWTMTALVAERFRTGSSFLAGDAAHAFPPTGGFGMNSGIQDAHNLAWKLADVLAGRGGPALLDSYETERRPVACLNATQSLQNADRSNQSANPAPAADELAAAATKSVRSASLTAETDEERRNLEMLEHGAAIGMDLGFAYDESPVIVGDGVVRPDTLVTKYIPNACPGARAPHMYVSHDGVERSLLAVFDDSFTLLVGAGGRGWQAAVDALGDDGLQLVMVGPEEAYGAQAGAMERLYGIGPTGAVLIRPDGHVAYRSHDLPDDSGMELARVWSTVLGHTPST